MEDMRIMVAEDTAKLAQYIRQALEENGYAVDSVADGASAERMIRSFPYDLVIMDVMLPEKDGVAVCRSLRQDDVNMPIMMVTAKGALEDRILGLDSGADDYLAKPFELKELLARVRALLRRPTETMIDQLVARDVVLDSAKHVVTQNGHPLALTQKEYAILEYLMRNAGSVVTREQLLEHCWDFAYSAFSNITDVYIKQLRKKLNDKHEAYIQTIRGVGYRFVS